MADEEEVIRQEDGSHGVRHAKATRRENSDQVGGYVTLHVDGVTGGTYNKSVVKLVLFEDRATSVGEAVKLIRTDCATLIVPRHLFPMLIKGMKDFDDFITKLDAERAEKAKKDAE